MLTLVKIKKSGWTELKMDLFYVEYSYLYHLETERIIRSAESDNFLSYKRLTVEYYVDHGGERYTAKLDFPKVRPPELPAWHAANIRSPLAPSPTAKRWWKNTYIGECPGVFEVSAAERESNPNFLGFYDDYERAKASFTSSVEHGHVYREQRIVRRVKMTMSDEYFGTTCDDELVGKAKGWHVVTVGRSPGVFVAASRFKAYSTYSNIRDIEGGTAAVFSTRALAVKHFADALTAGLVERCSVILIRENMTEEDYPGLITPWRF